MVNVRECKLNELSSYELIGVLNRSVKIILDTDQPTIITKIDGRWFLPSGNPVDMISTINDNISTCNSITFIQELETLIDEKSVNDFIKCFDSGYFKVDGTCMADHEVRNKNNILILEPREIFQRIIESKHASHVGFVETRFII